MDILAPDFYSRFQCTADKCSYTCCIGWGIIIDDETYKKYVKNEDKLGICANDWLEKKDGKIWVKKQHERCPMLNDQGLCNIVLKLGPEYLSDTCTIYPRVFNQYGFVSEINLKLSCPEVVKLLMEPDYIVGFGLTEQNTPHKKFNYVQEYLFQSKIRSILIDILSNYPDLSLQTKIYAVYNILDKAILHYENGQTDLDSLVPDIATFIDYNSLKNLDKTLSGIIKKQNQYQLVVQFKNLMKYVKANNAEHQKLLTQAAECLENISDKEYTEISVAFENSLKEYSGFFINYWISQIFSECIKVPDYAEARNQLAFIAGKLFFSNTLAFIEFTKTNTLNKDNYIEIISKSHRITDHNDSFKKQLINIFEKNNLISPAGILLLLFT